MYESLDKKYSRPGNTTTKVTIFYQGFLSLRLKIHRSDTIETIDTTIKTYHCVKYVGIRENTDQKKPAFWHVLRKIQERTYATMQLAN